MKRKMVYTGASWTAGMFFASVFSPDVQIPAMLIMLLVSAFFFLKSAFYKSKNIKYGTSENNLSNSIQINDNSTTSATLENLSVYTKYYIQVETVLSDDDKIISTTINKTTRNTSTSTDDLVNISSVDFAKKRHTT